MTQTYLGAVTEYCDLTVTTAPTPTPLCNITVSYQYSYQDSYLSSYECGKGSTCYATAYATAYATGYSTEQRPCPDDRSCQYEGDYYCSNYDDATITYLDSAEDCFEECESDK